MREADHLARLVVRLAPDRACAAANRTPDAVANELPPRLPLRGSRKYSSATLAAIAGAAISTISALARSDGRAGPRPRRDGASL
jgi:hypothetical protein